MKKNSTVLFVYTSLSSFVKNDIELLSKHFNVREHHYSQSKYLWGQAGSILKELIFLFRNIFKTKFIFIWFSDYHALLPVLFGQIFHKKVLLVVGGYDVAHIPDLGYGALKNPLRAFFTKYSLKNATVSLAVSNYIKAEILKIINQANTVVIYNGITLVDEIDSKIERQNIILTVGKIDTEQRYRLKGIDFFMKLAKELAEYKFVIIGIEDYIVDSIKSLPSNVTTYGFLGHEELKHFYNTSKVYCQFSVLESFGLAMLDAIYFGCKVIANDVGALSEIVGKNGTIIKPFDLMHAKKSIIDHIENFIYDKSISEEVSNKFSLMEREKKLIELFKTYNLFENENG